MVTLELAALSPTLASRVVADSRDRVAWVRARSRGITATDVASLTSVNAIAQAADAKLMGSGFSGNAYTAHGRVREPEIAGWVAATHGILPSSAPCSTPSSRSAISRRPTASSSTQTGASPSARSRRPTSRGAASLARTCVRCGGSSTSSEPSARWSRGRSTTVSSRSATSRAAPGSTATTPRSRKLVGSATSLIDELHRRTTQRPPVAPAAAERMPRPTPREPFRALALAD